MKSLNNQDGCGGKKRFAMMVMDRCGNKTKFALVGMNGCGNKTSCVLIGMDVCGNKTRFALVGMDGCGNKTRSTLVATNCFYLFLIFTSSERNQTRFELSGDLSIFLCDGDCVAPPA